jgi:hypothetical protein
MTFMAHQYEIARAGTSLADAVLVTLTRKDDSWVADVAWPPTAQTTAGSYLYATAVPLALERARDIMATYGFERVFVSTPDPAAWQPEWGELIT